MEISKKEIRPFLIKLLPNLPISGIDNLLKISTFIKKGNKEIISKSGNHSKEVILILKGSIRGYIINEDGTEKNVLLRSAGIFIADSISLFKNKPQRYTFETIGEANLLVLKFNDFEALAHKDPIILKLYLSVLKEAILRLTYRVESLITMKNEDRYLELLKLDPVFLRSAYSKHVANYLGMTPVSLSRIIKRVKEKQS
jgi:CRP-like cAMP-binding protein